MAELVSVVGGLFGSVSLDPKEVVAAQAALDAVSVGFKAGAIHSNLALAPDKAALNVYEITAVAGKTYVQKTGEQVVILQGSNSATLSGLANDANNLLIGNAGDDTINATGGVGTIIVGDGNNRINIVGGTETVITGAGKSFDTVVMQGGDLSLKGLAHKKVSVTGGSDTVKATGAVTVAITGSASLVLQGGTDTVTASGSATVTGGTGALRFQGGTNSRVVAGAGHETMIGGTGNSTFFGSKFVVGVDSMVGGTGKTLFVGGRGHDTMVSGSSHDVFEFRKTTPGGTHTIVGYNGADEIQLHGYTSANVKIGHVGGNTSITLSDGTHIVVKGATIALNQLHFT